MTNSTFYPQSGRATHLNRGTPPVDPEPTEDRAPATRPRMDWEAILFGVLLAGYMLLGWALLAGLADYGYLLSSQGPLFAGPVAR